ncbi:MAG: hypothetical protein ABI621_02925 [Chloroflexota bacterium]
MSIPNLLHNMCADLSDADLNAIRKARGFSPSETASRTSFASYFVSSIGLAEAMQNLSAEEVITLHLLHQTGEVDIAFFERLYRSAAQSGKHYYGTYTQQYKPTFDTVKKNLVRRGLVIMAEVKLSGDAVQLERWRFALPPEFVSYLSPFLPTITSDEPSEISDHTVRKKLLQLIGGSALPNDRTSIQLKDGTIWLDDQPFSTTRLQEWQKRAWWSSLNTLKPAIPASLSPTEAVISLLASLAPHEWVRPESLDPALKIYCYGSKFLPAEKILHRGWELGLFSRLKVDSVHLYRLAPELTPTDSISPLSASVSWMESIPKTDSVKIDLRLIPPHHLELLNVLTHLTVDAVRNTLQATPSTIKLGRATPQQRNSPLSLWLAEHVPAFGKVLADVNEKWGKTILHENLFIARVRDLNLRVQLERGLGGNLIVLSEHFIAFPSESRSGIEKVLKKTGFVAKIVKPS